VTALHRYLGAGLIVLFVVIMLWALTLRLMRREETPDGLLAVQHWTENLLVVQTVLGIVLLVMGRRVFEQPTAWLHYFYGSLFPLIAVVGGRLASLRRERYGYVGMAWGAFFAFGLTLRALQMGCGYSMDEIARCLRLA
jgi:multisubunit Na+/H+ antiporter MnhF subunit